MVSYVYETRFAHVEFSSSNTTASWQLHLSSQVCTWLFAYDRHDYARHIPEYITQLYQLELDQSDTWKGFDEGNFTVATNPIPFTAICVDQAQEHVNMVHKGDAGIIGITTNPESLLVLRYCLNTPELSLKCDDTGNCSRLNFLTTEI